MAMRIHQSRVVFVCFSLLGCSALAPGLPPEAESALVDHYNSFLRDDLHISSITVVSAVKVEPAPLFYDEMWCVVTEESYNFGLSNHVTVYRGGIQPGPEWQVSEQLREEQFLNLGCDNW